MTRAVPLVSVAMAPVKLLLLCAGNTMDDIAANHGDFDAWFSATVKDPAEWTVVQVHKNGTVPPLHLFDGVIISGSPASCTEWEPWMDALVEVVVGARELEMPLLGVCFGHQLMGTALGGRVTRNPAGREIGTVEAVLTTAGTTDPVLGPLFPSFRIQATHVDSVVEPPPGAEILARTAQEPCAAMRVGRTLYGVQFHPEITAPVMRRYISHRAKIIDGERGSGAADKLHAAVSDVKSGEAIMKRWVQEVVHPYQRARANGRAVEKRAVLRPRRDPAPREGFVEASDGQPIWFREEGRGAPAIMLLDGLGCDGYAWKYVVQQFKERHHIIRFHYAGHGKSAAPRGFPSSPSERLGIAGCADDAARVLDHLGVQRAVMMGHSMGVQVALEAWRRHPSRVGALALVCGSYGRPLRTFHGRDMMEKVLPYLQDVFNRSPRITRAVWKRLLSTELAYQVGARVEANAKLVKREDFAPYFTHLSGVDPLLFVEMVRNANLHTAEEWLHEVNVPTLIVAAEHDTFTPAHLSRHMQRTIPGAELLHVPSGTHTAPIELPELLTLRLEKFLATRVMGRQPALSTGMQGMASVA